MNLMHYHARVELRQLEHFVAVAEERSFTQGARRLNYVQSALSVSIRSLERELGVRLFDRNTHRVDLTDAGEALLPAARETLASVEHTRDLAAALQGVVRGTLRIGIMQSFGFLDVPAVLGEFHRRHPHVEIEMRPSPGGSLALVDELKRGGIDIAFASVMDDPVGVTTTELGVEELYLVGVKELLPPARARMDLSDLADSRFVDFPRGWGVRAVVDNAFAAAGTDRRVTIEVADVNTLIALLHAGLGVALAPPSLFPRDHGLAIRRLTAPITWRAVMALPKATPIRAAAGAFAELVLDAVSIPFRTPVEAARVVFPKRPG
jgi:DNA-binding transcriptional LysR family regulator